MRLFTLDEANDLLPALSADLRKIQRLYERLGQYRDRSREASAAAEKGGGMEGGTAYVKLLYQIGKVTTHIHDMGVQLKDHSRGLIDFPSLRDDRIVLLCWQLGEGDRIEWWHEVEAGFAGRQPL
jgi:hypothetical protein